MSDYKKILNPFVEAVARCLDAALAEYFSGNMTKEEAIDYGVKLIDDYAESEALKEVLDDYYDSFVDIKDFDWGEKDDFVL